MLNNNFLFSLGVLSALRHDSIIDAGDPDYALVEGEAERVAKEAVRYCTLEVNSFTYILNVISGSDVKAFTS